MKVKENYKIAEKQEIAKKKEGRNLGIFISS